MLTLRVYRKSGLNSYTPMMYIHGGGWIQGAFSDLEEYAFFNDDPGLFEDILNADELDDVEIQVELDDGPMIRLLDQGFMIYAADYRVSNGYRVDEQGQPLVVPDAACEGSGEDLISDVQYVLESIHSEADWLPPADAQHNSQRKVVLFGQSAGGHVAHYLASHFPQMVKKFYNESGAVSFAHMQEIVLSGGLVIGQFPMNSLLASVEPVETRQALLEAHSEPLAIADADACQCAVPAFVQINSFETFYDPELTPPGYVVSNLLDRFMDYRNGNRFCESVALAHGGSFDLNAPDKEFPDQLRIEHQCGGDNVLDRGVWGINAIHGLLSLRRFTEVEAWLTF